MEHTVNGIGFRVEIAGPHPKDATKRVNGCALTAAASWASVRALVGADVPGLGVVLDVGAPRVDPLPIGARINLVTAEIVP